MLNLTPPHGGKLINRILTGPAAADARARAAQLPRLDLDEGAEADLEMLSMGAFSPLTGYLDQADYRGVVEHMQLADGTLWPIPIVLPAPDEIARAAESKKGAALAVGGEIIGAVEVREAYARDVEKEAEAVYRTKEDAHPGVANIRKGPQRLLAGPVSLFSPVAHDDFDAYRLAPAATRAAFAQRKWKTVVAFQTRNPIHRAHEYLTKVALEGTDGLLLHPLVGKTKGDDIPAPVRMKCYEVLLEKYYPKDRTLLAVMPAKMHYAGPREAILHAVIRQNYGCSHIIIGRDHAGVGKYYGSYDAQEIFDDLPEGALRIKPLKFEHTFYCKACEGMASGKTCPHGDGDRVILSGTAVRGMLTKGEIPPIEFTRPEVAKVLIEEMARKV